MPRLLCCHPNCPVHEDVEVLPFNYNRGYDTWYCREHRGATASQPKPEHQEPAKESGDDIES